MPSDAFQEFSGQDPWEREPSADEQVRFQQLFGDLMRRQPSLKGQQQQLWVCLQALQSLTQSVVRALASDAPRSSRQGQQRQEVLQDLRSLQAWLLSVEVLLERTGEVNWLQAVERLAQELVGELAPDPGSLRRLQLNQLLDLSSGGDCEPF